MSPTNHTTHPWLVASEESLEGVDAALASGRHDECGSQPWLDRPTAAVVYANRGWAVVPLSWPTADGCSCRLGIACSKAGKHPWLRWSYIDASTRWPKDPVSVHHLFRDRPESNVGILTGATSGVFVLDVDGAVGEESLWRLQTDHGPLPVTLTAQTGSGGRHLLFAYPGPTPTTASRLGTGLDTRSDGGLIVAAPSRHRSGQIYRWINWWTEPAPVPSWLVELLTAASTPPVPRATVQRDRGQASWSTKPAMPLKRMHGTPYGKKALKGELAKVRDAVEGIRNPYLVRSAYKIGQLIESCRLNLDEVTTVFVGAAAGIGLDQHEAHRTVASGLKAGMAHPRLRP